jgi:hypothetical protein
MNTPSKFVKIIRQKLIPIQRIASSSSKSDDLTQLKDQDNDPDKLNDPDIDKQKGETIKSNKCGTRYVGISNTDMPQRVQHAIRNLMELDEEELAYIEDMNCRNMFEIVKLLNNVVATLVENMMSIDN